MSERLVIAVDGHSACGKSTLARDIASALQIVHIDSGAMYRAVGLHLLRADIPVDERDSILLALPDIKIEIRLVDGMQHILLNGEDVEREIRTAEVTEIVSEIAAIPEVRRKLVSLQRRLSDGLDVIMDGRDIGTVVFPEANVKFFLTADMDVRVMRRKEELRERGQLLDIDQVRDNLIKRDHIDSTRSDSPLKVAEDAIVLDNSRLNRRQQLAEALKIIKSKTGRPQKALDKDDSTQ